MSIGTLLLRGLGVGLILFIGIQFLPYGEDPGNPPVGAEPSWDSPRTRDLVRKACFDCHSNETRWPWYGTVAPASWLLRHDVLEGRRHLNFSEWHRPQKEADEAAEAVRAEAMPPWFYRPLHPEARLSPDEKEALAAGLERTFGKAD